MESSVFTDCSTDADGILSIKVFLLDKDRFDDEDLKSMVNEYRWLTDERVPVLIDCRDIYVTLSFEVGKYLSTQDLHLEMTSGVAVVVNSLPNRLLFTYFGKYLSGTPEIKLFDAIEDARIWLLDNDRISKENNMNHDN